MTLKSSEAHGKVILISKELTLQQEWRPSHIIGGIWPSLYLKGIYIFAVSTLTAIIGELCMEPINQELILP
jgi:hypothetical protein